MNKPSVLLFIFFALSAGGTYLFENSNKNQVNRKIAGQIFQELITEENQNFQIEITSKLFSLHSHYVMAQKHFYDFANASRAKKTSNFKMNGIYHSLTAVKKQIDKIENEFLEISYAMRSLPKSKESIQKQLILNDSITHFGKKNKLQQLSILNLSELMGIEITKSSTTVTYDEISVELATLEKIKEFITYQKNLEHISYKMEIELKNSKNDKTLKQIPQTFERFIKRTKSLVHIPELDASIYTQCQSRGSKQSIKWHEGRRKICTVN